jgi:Holliday junction DNA helicase RuvA
MDRAGSGLELITRLVGKVIDDDDGLVVDVRGVGYEVTAPLGTRGRLTPDANGDCTVYVHTHVREDAISLFGFASLHERAAFRVLIGISNVGPKLALSVLGAIAVDELAVVVERGELGKLVAIPGVGKRTAERLVLELKGKLPRVGAPTAPLPVAAPGAGSAKSELLLGALTRMGYKPGEAERAVVALGQSRSLDESPLGDLVREALALLAR